MYHWTLDYCLNMPARSFFAMLEQSRILRATDYMHLCDIQFISNATFEYYEKVRGRFALQIRSMDVPMPAAPVEDRAQAGGEPAEPLTDVDAHNAMIHLFTPLKGGR